MRHKKGFHCKTNSQTRPFFFFRCYRRIVSIAIVFLKLLVSCVFQRSCTCYSQTAADRLLLFIGSSIFIHSQLYFLSFFLYTKLSIATHTHTHKRGKRKSLVISFVLILILLAINQCQHRSVNSERERESICPFRFLWRVDVHHTPNLELFIEQLLFYLYLFICFFNKKREEEEHWNSNAIRWVLHRVLR